MVEVRLEGKISYAPAHANSLSMPKILLYDDILTPPSHTPCSRECSSHRGRIAFVAMRIWIFFVTVSAASFGPFTNSSICSTVVQCQQTYAANTSLPHTPVVAISSTREPISNTTAKPKEAVKVQATSAGNGTISKAKVTSSNTKTAWSFVTDDPNKGLPRTGTGT